ncbi:hypothetical protein [Streptomyces sp. NPDC091217]|uniref:hypothetical protein n=1 Tax=Streptomyces sp. NPDC091217 TaxID=3365975 RepID=UPI0038171C90
MIGLKRMDSLVVGGYIGAERAEETADAVPAAWQRVLDRRRFERLAAPAPHLHPDGLGPVLARC